jgi:hypothetical protein
MKRQTVQGKHAQSNQGCQAANLHQDYQVFCGTVQFFLDPYQGFRTHCRTTILAHMKGLGLQIRPSSRTSSAGFYALQKQLTLEPVMAFPKADQQYTLIMSVATGTADTLG